MGLRADPARCGLLVLLVWQVVPLLLLMRHALPVYPHYLLILIPGPYLFIGYFLAQSMHWLQRFERWGMLLRIVVVGMTVLLIGGQLLGSVGTMFDGVRGNYPDTALSQPYYNDLNSLQQAVSKADQLAQQRHLNRIYIATDSATRLSLTLLSAGMRTPTTVFDDKSCLVLPNAGSGPAVMLLSPRSPLSVVLMTHFARATLISQPARLGGPPFQLYIVNPTVPSTAISSQNTFQGHLQMLDTYARSVTTGAGSWQITRWTMLHAVQAEERVTYGYSMTVQIANEHTQTSKCSFSSIRANDQLLVAFAQTNRAATAQLNIKAQFYTIQPRTFSYGPLTFETDAWLTQWTHLVMQLHPTPIR
jgi:hypothetical protein